MCEVIVACRFDSDQGYMRRLDILNSKDKILNWVNENIPKSIICKNLKCKPETLDAYLIKLGIEYKGNVGRKGFKRVPIQDYLDNKLPIKSNELKLKLYSENLKEEKCEECEITEWMNSPIVFELHHVDGDIHNNNLDNLKILCPNCHSQTNDFRKKKQSHETIIDI